MSGFTFSEDFFGLVSFQFGCLIFRPLVRQTVEDIILNFRKLMVIFTICFN